MNKRDSDCVEAAVKFDGVGYDEDGEYGRQELEEVVCLEEK